MEISKQQPMRPAEIELVERINEMNQTLGMVNILSNMEWGSQNDIEVIANNNTVINVSFDKEKKQAPIVLITLQNNDDETNINAYAALKDVSTSGFHVRIYNLNENDNQQMKVNWIAIGE